jgi:hypothetical protein
MMPELLPKGSEELRRGGASILAFGSETPSQTAWRVVKFPQVGFIASHRLPAVIH